MKAIKRTLALILALTAILVLVSCGSGTDPFSYIESEEKSESNASAAKKIENLDEFEYQQASGRLILFKKEEPGVKTTYKVYNIKTGAFVASVENNEATSIKKEIRLQTNQESSTSYMTVTEYDGDTFASVRLLDSNGNEVAKSETASSPVFLANGLLVTFADKLYSIVRNEIFSFVTDIDEFSLINDIDGIAGDYYIIDNLEKTSGSLLALNKKGELVSSYSLKTEYTENGGSYKCGILPNGNVVFQYKELLPSDAKKYDIAEISTASGEATELKFKLITEIYSLKNGKITEEKVDFSIQSSTASSGISEDVALLEIHRIDNKREAEESEFVFVDGKLNIKASFKDWFDSFEAVFPMVIFDDTYIFSSADGVFRAVKKDGTVLKTIPQNLIFEIVSQQSGKYFYLDDGIYKASDFSKIHDLKANKQTVIAQAKDFFILLESTPTDGGEPIKTYFKYTGGSASKIMSSNDENLLWKGYYDYLDSYCIRETKENGEYTYKFYSTAGTVLYKKDSSTDISISPIASYDGIGIVNIDGEYYRFY